MNPDSLFFLNPSPDYPTPEEPTAATTQILTRSQAQQEYDAAQCLLKGNLLSTLSDHLHCAWNGWEMAVKFEDEERQDYYMKFVVSLHDQIKKVRKF